MKKKSSINIKDFSKPIIFLSDAYYNKFATVEDLLEAIFKNFSTGVYDFYEDMDTEKVVEPDASKTFAQTILEIYNLDKPINKNNFFHNDLVIDLKHPGKFYIIHEIINNYLKNGSSDLNQLKITYELNNDEYYEFFSDYEENEEIKKISKNYTLVNPFRKLSELDEKNLKQIKDNASIEDYRGCAKNLFFY